MVSGISSQTLARMAPSAKMMRQVHTHFVKNYPIASKMLVREELIKGAILTRFMVGLARVHINIPRSDKKVELTRAQKYQSFLERVFIEIINIPLQVATMFFTQEFVARTLEKSRFCAPPTVQSLAKTANYYLGEKYTPSQLKSVSSAIYAQFKNRKGLIAEKIYMQEKIRARIQPIRNGVLQNLVKSGAEGVSSFSLVSKMNQLTDAALGQYFSRVRLASALSLTSGMLTGAIISGYILQTINDRYFSTTAVPAILRAFGILPKQAQGDAVTKISQMPAIQDRTFII